MASDTDVKQGGAPAKPAPAARKAPARTKAPAATKKVAAKKVATKKTVTKKVVTKKATTTKKSPAVAARVATVAEAVRQETSHQERYEMIANMAYFRAEQRGFEPGWEVHDWLESERMIDEQLKHQRRS